MAQMAQQSIMKMEISDSCVCAQHLVGDDEVEISLIELGPSGGLVATGFYHCGECYNSRAAEVINDMVDASCLILDVDMELLQLCGPLLMAFILQFALSLHELQGIMIVVDDCILPENVMLPLAAGLHNQVNLFFVINIFMDEI